MTVHALGTVIGCPNCKRTKRYVQLCDECYERGQAACKACSGTGKMPMGVSLTTGERRDDDLCGCPAGLELAALLRVGEEPR